MPIDDALGEIEGVPEYILKESFEIMRKFPETTEELQEMYKDKFVFEFDFDNHWVSIASIKDDFKDINNVRSFVLHYEFEIIPDDDPFNGIKTISLHQKDNIHQSLLKDSNGFDCYLVNGKGDFSEYYDTNLEEWFEKMEQFIKEQVPELEEFVRKNAN
jgi:hypothetical protein